MIDKNSLLKVFDVPLRQGGFLKKGVSWYLDGTDTIIVVNLESISMYSPGQYAVNIGFWLKKLGNSSFPKYNHCHMYYRLERLFPESREEIIKGCSLSTGDAQSLIDLSNFIKNRLIPFLKECTLETKIKELFLTGVLNRGFMKFEVREYLSML